VIVEKLVNFVLFAAFDSNEASVCQRRDVCDGERSMASAFAAALRCDEPDQTIVSVTKLFRVRIKKTSDYLLRCAETGCFQL